jgi:hypothetical protein
MTASVIDFYALVRGGVTFKYFYSTPLHGALRSFRFVGSGARQQGPNARHKKGTGPRNGSFPSSLERGAIPHLSEMPMPTPLFFLAVLVVLVSTGTS